MRPNIILKQLQQRIWPKQPDASPLILGQRRIYILPTRAGLAYACTLGLMLIASINYNLSLGYGLVFLLAGLGVVTIVHTFRNLAGLGLHASRNTPGFAGESVTFAITLVATRPRHALQLSFTPAATILSSADNNSLINLPTPAEKRGWQSMPRLTISTTWPLGLIRAWSYARFNHRVLVYPAPASSVPEPPATAGAAGRTPQPAPEDFYGLRSHQAGDMRQHIAWKASARLDEGLLTKQFVAEAGATRWLELAQAPGDTLEQKISVMTRWVLDAHAAEQSYGLKLGTQTIAQGQGADHLQHCLEALALHV